MIPSLSPPGKHILTLKVIFMEFIICHERLVTPCIAIYAGNFKYTFWKRWVLDTSHEQKESSFCKDDDSPISSLRAVGSGWTCRGTPWVPRAWGGARAGSVSHVTAPQVEQKWHSPTRRRASFQATRLALFIFFIRVLPFYEKTTCDHEMQYTFISQKVYSVPSQSAVFYWITLEYSLLLQKVPIVCQLALGKDYLLPKAEKISHPSSYEIHLILQNSEDFR